MKKYLIIAGLLSAVLCSCKKEMVSSSITKDLGEFDTLTLNSVFEVSITQDTINRIVIKGAKKIIEEIDILNQDNTLALTNTYKGNWVHPENNKIQVELHINGLSRINALETCNITSTNQLTGNEIGLVMTSKLNNASLKLNCQSFYFWNNFPCGGKVVLEGTTNELKIWSYALMAVDAAALQTNITTIDNYSKGDCYVNCAQKLMYALKGKGNIYLSGQPAHIIETAPPSSTGQLIIQ